MSTFSVVMMAAATLSPCEQASADLFGVPHWLLGTVRMLEGGQPGQAVQNTNGSEDVGPYQINSVHRPRLEALGVEWRWVKNDTCVGATVAAHLLAGHARRSGDWVQALADYHSRTAKHAGAYLSRLDHTLERR